MVRNLQVHNKILKYLVDNLRSEFTLRPDLIHSIIFIYDNIQPVGYIQLLDQILCIKKFVGRPCFEINIADPKFNIADPEYITQTIKAIKSLMERK